MKGKKYIVPLLLAGVTATGVVTNIQQAVSVQATNTQNTSMTGVVLELEGGFEDKYVLGENDNKIYLPKVTTSTGDYEYTVTKGAMNIKIEKDTTLNQYYFQPLDQGYYNIGVVAKAEDVVVSEVQNFSIYVEKATGKINLPVNSKYVIPAKIPAGIVGFVIPAPSVKVGNNAEVTPARLMGNDLRVRLIDPANKSIPLTLTTNTNTNNSGELVYDEFYNVTNDKITNPGTYTIVYEYVVGATNDTDGTVISRLESNFQVVKDDSFVEKINLTIKPDDSNFSGKKTVGTDVDVPKIKVTDTSNPNGTINTYIQVKITNITTGEVLDASEFDYENYKFHPTKVGEYMITYTASIPLFDKSTTEVTSRKKINVVDNESPTVIPTYNYDVDTNGNITKVYIDGEEKTVVADTDRNMTASEVAEELLINRQAYIPSSAVLGDNGEVTIKVPAVFATDNLDSYKDLKSNIKRYVKFENGTMEEIPGDITKEGSWTFKSKGSYQIIYRSTDLAENTPGRFEHDIEIYNKGDLADGKTVIDFSISAKTISDREKKFTFRKPEFEIDYDDKLDVRTYYELVGVTGAKPVELTETNGDNEYVLDIQDILSNNKTATGLKIYAKAYVDSTLLDTRDEFKTSKVVQDPNTNAIIVSSETFNINFIKSANDKTAATFGIYTDVVDTSGPEPVTTTELTNWNTALLNINKDITIKRANDKDVTVKEIDENGYAIGSNDQRITNSYSNDLAAFDMGSKQNAESKEVDAIKLPEVRFTDSDANLNVSVTVKDVNGDPVKLKTPFNVKTTEASGEYVHKVTGASFSLNNYGIYTVTYQAKDTAGNFYVQSFGIRVNDKRKPSIVVVDEDKFDKTIEVGKKFIVPTPKLVKDDKTYSAEYVKWDMISATGEWVPAGDNAFVPLSDGVFTIRYSGTDDQENEAFNQLYTVKAEDTVKPEITLDTTYFMPKSLDFVEDEGKTYMTINFPIASADDGRFKDQPDYGYGKALTVNYTVTDPKGKEIKSYEYTSEQIAANPMLAHVRYFEASKEGKYTIKYDAMDDAGNKADISPLTLSLGDCVAPTIDWKEDSDIPNKTVTLDELKENDNVYTLDLSGLLLSDEGATEEETQYLYDNIKATLSKSGSTLPEIGDENFQWKITEAGTYTLKITVKDKAGNEEIIPYTITVPEEEVEEEKISPVVGTVLVVLSVVVLAGVVVYFVVSSKKKNVKVVKKSSKKK